MRPDIVAFRELDTLVRNLSEQLAGYRRRALAAESRARELEQQLAAVINSAGSTDRAASTAAASLPAELELENERLRARLVEARERTIQVADRVRFLRQQLTGGVER